MGVDAEPRHVVSGCAFCAIVAGTLPASTIAASARSLAFVDLRQPSDAHVLVVPRVHVERLHQLEPDDAADLFTLTVRVAAAIEAEFAPAGMNLWQSNGEAGGQEVPHVHLHLLTRRVGDGLLRIYREAPPLPARAALDDIAERLRSRMA